MKNQRARKRSSILWLVTMVSTGLLRVGLGATGDENWDCAFGVPGADGPVYTINTAGSDVYFGGQFTRIGGINVANIAKWNGTYWTSVGGGVTGGVFPNVLASAILNGELYIGGLFTDAAGLTANNIARWDGAEWVALGAGVNSIVRAMSTDGTNLYVAGTFTQAGGINATNIAKWDGTNWSALGGGIPGQAVDSVAVGGGYVYAGGRFALGGEIGATNIARWDGTNWSALGKGLRSTTGDGGGSAVVRSLLVKGNELYAGGAFRLAGDVVATNIARWDGTNWWPVGRGIKASGEVDALLAAGRDLYVGGFFNSAGVVAANHIAKWDGEWAPLGEGVNDQYGSAAVQAMARNGCELFLGGFFATAGGKSSANIALWHIPHALNVERVAEQLHLSWPATGTNFLLEACTQLSGTSWIEVPAPPALVDDQLVVTIELDGATRFYRLRKK